MTAKEVLIAAKALIDTPDKWCKGAYFEPQTGQRCALGAITGVKAHWRTRLKALHYLEGYDNLTPVDVACFNDAQSTRHEDIMALFDRAIEAAS